MIIRKKALLYDIENMAFTIADTGENDRHTLHRVRDICQDGNIDRVARVLGLAYAHLLTVLQPVLVSSRINIDKEESCQPHDYRFNLREQSPMKFLLTKERKLKIKETAHEFMVCMVLADWLAITLPEAADVWKFRAEGCLEVLKDLIATIVASSFRGGFRRKLSPF
ncbi:MAG: hypothetical protein J1F67_12640 [Muribaculaceae bacterium]|nr:hypothetical protein [Muribaculaceae bacterium]